MTQQTKYLRLVEVDSEVVDYHLTTEYFSDIGHFSQRRGQSFCLLFIFSWALISFLNISEKWFIGINLIFPLNSQEEKRMFVSAELIGNNLIQI